jgi:hypothetical protein
MTTKETDLQRMMRMSIPEAYQEWERMNEIEEMGDKEFRRVDLIQRHVLACTPRNYAEMAIKAKMIEFWMHSDIPARDIIIMWERDIRALLKGATTSAATLAVAA